MIRIVYSDLDGTMVGPGGCLFRTAESELTLEPARALIELLDAGLDLVLVSGRTRPQLVEAARLVGADGFIGELGAVVGWDRGRSVEVLGGAMPRRYGDRRPLEVVRELGVVSALFDRWPGRLEWHAPWHRDHEADAMLRGQVEVADVHRLLDEQGLSWLRLRDNGVLAPGRPTGLDPDVAPVHVYHLMPDGLSKGLGVRHDLARRGLAREEAIAIGDSASDLDMAPYVRRLWLVANGAAEPHMADLIAAHDNVVVADAPVGLGWAQAVRSALTPVRA